MKISVRLGELCWDGEFGDFGNLPVWAAMVLWYILSMGNF